MSVAGAGTGEAAEAGQGAGEGQGAAQGAAQGLPEGFAERFEQFASSFEGLPDRIDRIEGALQAPPAEQQRQQPQQPDSRYLLDPESGFFFDRLSNEWLEEPPGDYGAEQELSPQQIQAMIAQGVEQGLEPERERTRMAQFAALQENYADLRDPKVVEGVVQEAQGLIQRMSPDASPDAWKQHPELIEKLYLAGRAGEQAEGEVSPTGEPESVLEGSAASTAGQKALDDEGDAIVAAGQKGSFFMGG